MPSRPHSEVRRAWHRFAGAWCLLNGLFRCAYLGHHRDTTPLAFGASIFLAIGMSCKHQEIAVRAIVALSRINFSSLELGPTSLPPLFVFLLLQLVDVDIHVAPLALVKIEPVQLDKPGAKGTVQRQSPFQAGRHKIDGKKREPERVPAYIEPSYWLAIIDSVGFARL